MQEIASVYNFIFRTLVDANRRHDERKLDDALRVLAVERETWRLVCQQDVELPAVRARATRRPSPALPGVSLAHQQFFTRSLKALGGRSRRG